ncbi:hypothetical protein BC828DRAFT_402975 [Blastocladiella britannica]|nr:hypothetical protein BC828DRAFT_402975 [Blastocladiella britannica]
MFVAHFARQQASAAGGSVRTHLARPSTATTSAVVASSSSLAAVRPMPTLVKRRMASSSSDAKAGGSSKVKSVVVLAGFSGLLFGLTQYFLNEQRRKNLIMDVLLFQLRTNPTLREELGDNVNLAGWKWISGEINQIRGWVDVSFDVTGSTGKVARVEVKMQQYPNDRRKWETLDYFVATPQKSWNGYVDEDSGTLVLRGGQA